MSTAFTHLPIKSKGAQKIEQALSHALLQVFIGGFSDRPFSDGLASHGLFNPGQEVLDVGKDCGPTLNGAPSWAPADCAPQYIAAGGSVLANERPATVSLAGALATVVGSGTDHSVCELVKTLQIRPSLHVAQSLNLIHANLVHFIWRLCDVWPRP